MEYNPPDNTENYDNEVKKLESIYKEAVLALTTLLSSINLSNFNQREVEKKVNKILSDTDKKVNEWVLNSISKSYREGKAITLVTLEIEKSIQRARESIKLSNFDKQTIKQISQVTYNDLLLMTNNTRQRVKDILSKIVMENMRGKEVGVYSKELSNKIIKDLREQLLKEADFAIIDRANKRWSIESYSNMIARTKMMQAQMEGILNEALKRESYYGVISSHGSKHLSCRKWEGKIVKLVDNAKGDFPLLSELRAYGSGIFHPNCKHHVFPVRDVDFLPEKIRKDNEL